MSLSLVFPGIMCLAVVVPLFTLLAWKQLDKRRDRRSPLTEALVRLPGESLRERIEERASSIVYSFFAGLVFPTAALAYLFNRWVDPERIHWGGATFFALVMVLIGVLISIGWSWHVIRDVRRLRDGFEGELATAQLLAPLQAEGWLLFHDIPSQRGNIDHVLLGPNGVFAVETKYRAKPRSLKGKQSADAEYDGQRIRFAGRHSESLPLEQALAVAADLSRQLSDRIGERVEVTPVVALPGWYVRLTAAPQPRQVGVINPKTHGWLKGRQGNLDDAKRQRLAAALRHLACRPPRGGNTSN